MPKALISVSNKEGIVEFARQLKQLQFELISTGGTQATLAAAGIQTTPIEQVTSFPEILDGRVKTLHPAVHAGILARRDLKEHLATLAMHHIDPIDLVVVNLYPFKETLQKEAVTDAELIEQIDIGGPSMVRSAAKNHAAVTVIVDPNDYSAVLSELQSQQQTTLATRQKLAAKAFRHTAAYDSLIANYLTQQVDSPLPETITLSYPLKQSLRYGENSQQQAAFYQSPFPESFSIAQAQQLNGKELSYNNIKDADAALRIIREFTHPTAIALKHMNPCGVGQAPTIETAFERCYQADPISIFGGIVVLNRTVTYKLATQLNDIFLEIIIAPHFDKAALTLLSQKKNLRLLTLDFTAPSSKTQEVVSVLGGLLVQDQDWQTDAEEQSWVTMTKRHPTEKEYCALKFAWSVVKHVKSNAIVIANQHQTLGIGAGQMNRIGAAKIALEQAQASGFDLSTAVMASDAFFPMDDTVQLAASYGIRAIIQPGGSLRDQDSIDRANEHDIAMIKTFVRHFRH